MRGTMVKNRIHALLDRYYVPARGERHVRSTFSSRPTELCKRRITLGAHKGYGAREFERARRVSRRRPATVAPGSHLARGLSREVRATELHRRHFAWTAADSILAKFRRLCKVINANTIPETEIRLQNLRLENLIGDFGPQEGLG